MVFYAGQDRAAPGDGEPDARGADRPQRPGRPALRHLLPRCQDLLRQTPVQAESREDLREAAQASPPAAWSSPRSRSSCPRRRADSYPLLSDRRNIVVIADEAHRSQYDFIDGFARHMRDALPNASFIGFTGTPIELTDKNTRAVFGDYIDVYDIQRAVEDGATVPIYYESRLAKLELNEDERPKIDPEFEEVTEGEEDERQGEAQEPSGPRLEAMVGTEKRIGLIAAGPGGPLREAAGGDGRQGA